MKDIFTTVQGSPCIMSVTDMTDQQITVNGRVWRFDFDWRFGPLWLKKTGEARECQYPNKAVWNEFQKWLDKQERPPGYGPKRKDRKGGDLK